MKVAVTGSSGLIGGALTSSLLADSHDVVKLVRRAPEADDEVQWDPKAGTVDLAGLRGVDAVAHFAGAGVGNRRWTSRYKREIRDSRVLGTRTLARAIASLDPSPTVLLSGSAIGYYGDTGDEPVDESSPNGSGFLAQVVVAWEGATAIAKDSGVRVVHPRSGLVVSRHGGAWGRMWPIFKLGVGGKLGNGRQYWSFVSLRDEVRALRRMLEDPSMSGAYNVTAPHPATNAEITETMAEMLHRPSFARVPAFALRTALGEMSQEVLGSALVVSKRLQAAGFTFEDPTFVDACRTALREESADHP